jgi:hypothetical protein
MTLPTHEFIRRFLIHGLPKGLHRIRHYGLFANGKRSTNIALARELLAMPPRVTQPEAAYRGVNVRYPRSLGHILAWIDAILEGDSQIHKKQRHTARRIFERLRDEQGFSGGYTIVREYIAKAMLQRREMFVPLSHRPFENHSRRAVILKPDFNDSRNASPAPPPAC